MKTWIVGIIGFLVLSTIIHIKHYIKQQRLNRLLLTIFYSLPLEEKNYILDHTYFQDCLDLKQDMNKMINCDIDLSDLEEILKKQKNGSNK